MSRETAAAEWRRCLQCLAAARLCHQNGLYADSISRAYYAVMHAAKAALELRNVTVGTHAGVRNTFGWHFIHPGLIERTWSADIRRLSDLRAAADYNVHAIFGEDQVLVACNRAEAFLGRIREVLGEAIPGDGPEQSVG